MRRFSFEFEQYADAESGGELERQVTHVDSETVTLADIVERFVLFLQAVGYPVASIDVALDTEIFEDAEVSDEEE